MRKRFSSVMNGLAILCCAGRFGNEDNRQLTTDNTVHPYTCHRRKPMPSYYMSEDLARFGEISKANPKGWDAFLNWYQATMAPGALDEKTKKLIALAVAYAIQEPYCIDSYSSACSDAG